MGLDITAYSNLKHIGKHEIDPALNEGEPGPHCYYENHVDAFAYDTFPQSFRGIPVLDKESSNGQGFLIGGCFEISEATETHGFRAGSYGGYNEWRRHLQERFNPNRDPQRPFYELIWFADNEGSIGPEAAQDLLADFLEHDGLFAPDDEWMRRKYQDWTRAFVLAANSGLVRFH